MFILLSLINVALLVVFVNLYKKFTSAFVPVFFAFYYFLFFIIRPYGQVFFQVGLDDTYRIVKYSIMYQISGILFLLTMILVGMWAKPRWQTKVKGAWLFSFPPKNHSGYLLAFAIFFSISYGVNVFREKSFLYPFESGDIFAAEMALAHGEWFLNILAASVTVATLAWYSTVYYRVSKRASLLLLIPALLIIMQIGRDSARTIILVVFLSWVFCYPNVVKKSIGGMLQLMIVGCCCIVLLVVLGKARTNSSAPLSGEINLVLLSAFGETRPADNALLVFDHYSSRNFQDFRYLAGAITPLCLVPSKLLPLKPESNKDEQLTNAIFPLGIDLTYYHEGSTLTFTVPASGYADFGWIGVVVASFLYSLIYLYYAALGRGDSGNKFISTYLLLTHIAAMRLSIETCFVGLYTAMLFYGLFKCISRIRLLFFFK